MGSEATETGIVRGTKRHHVCRQVSIFLHLTPKCKTTQLDFPQSSWKREVAMSQSMLL